MPDIIKKSYKRRETERNFEPHNHSSFDKDLQKGKFRPQFSDSSFHYNMRTNAQEDTIHKSYCSCLNR